LPVTLNITGSNSFADVQTIATLAPGASAIVNFTAFTPTVTGTNNISVTIPADDDNTNNISITQQIVNTNTWSYSQGNTSTGTAGFNGKTIDLVSKYYNSTATLLSQAAVYFSVNGQPYKIGVWDASGTGGSPGSLLFETTLQTSVAGVNMVPVIPALPVNVGNFYIGVRQTTTTNFNLLRQTESPLRSNTFYYLLPLSAGWVDNSIGSSNRFMIDPKLQTPFDAFLTNITLPNNGAVTCGSSNQTISVQLTNTGANTIAANNATVTLKITGANTQTVSLTNTSNIVSGGNENISFTGISLLNPGTNNVTAYVNLAGDAESLNDTLIRTQNTIGVGLETAANTYPLTTVCEDMGWTYYNDAAQKSLLPVEWGTNTASKAAATASLTLDAALFTATSGSGAGANGTFTMKRYWNVDVAGMQPTTPVNVRFFYDAAEKNATDAAASNFQLANPGSVLKSPSWFKTNSGSFSADGAHVTADAVLNAISLTDVNTTANTINGILYAQFDGITSFSGGTYAAGVGTATLLPVSIDYFKARKAANEHVLNWKLTCIGSAFLKIIVERGNDGKQFDVINEQTATEVRCLQEFIFADKNPLPGTNFYRLQTITPDGKIIYSKIVALINKPSGFQLIGVSPNPVNSKAAINITTVNSGTFLLLVTDVAGKALVKKTVFVPAGNSFIKLDFDAFGVGTYFVTVTNGVAENSTLRIVKQ